MKADHVKESFLEVTCMDHDTIGGDDFMGWFSIPLSEVPFQQALDKWYPLLPKSAQRNFKKKLETSQPERSLFSTLTSAFESSGESDSEEDKLGVSGIVGKVEHSGITISESGIDMFGSMLPEFYRTLFGKIDEALKRKGASGVTKDEIALLIKVIPLPSQEEVQEENLRIHQSSRNLLPHAVSASPKLRENSDLILKQQAGEIERLQQKLKDAEEKIKKLKAKPAEAQTKDKDWEKKYQEQKEKTKEAVDQAEKLERENKVLKEEVSRLKNAPTPTVNPPPSAPVAPPSAPVAPPPPPAAPPLNFDLGGAHKGQGGISEGIANAQLKKTSPAPKEKKPVDSQAALLTAIRKGKTLKHVDESQKISKTLQSDDNLIDSLADALVQRRKRINDIQDQDESEDSSSWSD